MKVDEGCQTPVPRAMASSGAMTDLCEEDTFFAQHRVSFSFITTRGQSLAECKCIDHNRRGHVSSDHVTSRASAIGGLAESRARAYGGVTHQKGNSISATTPVVSYSITALVSSL
ncbi:hypothetical protein ACOMHN_028271 [Nucella lapillus]